MKLADEGKLVARDGAGPRLFWGLQEVLASDGSNHIQEKNLFRDHFDPIFLHRKGWGIKIT